MSFFKSKENIGIIFIVFAFLSFSILDAVQKTIVINHSIFQLLFIKYIFILLLAFLESIRKKNYTPWITNNIKLQVSRSIISMVESGCFVLSFRYLTLADVHSIAALTPVIVVILSAIILKEKVSLKTWIAIFIGFLAVLLILRPGSSIFDIKSLIPLFGAFFFGIYQIITKQLARTDENETSLFYTSIIALIPMFILSYYFWEKINYNSYFLFIGAGIFFSIGMYFQIIALSKARASIIQPFHYTLIFWAILFGYFIYNDLPDLLTIFGACVIAISGIYVIKQKD